MADREALAKALWLADTRGADPAWQEMAWADMGGSEPAQERAQMVTLAANLLADPGPLLAALAEAGVLDALAEAEAEQDNAGALRVVRQAEELARTTGLTFSLAHDAILRTARLLDAEAERDALAALVREAALETYTPDGSERFVAAFHRALGERDALAARLAAVEGLVALETDTPGSVDGLLSSLRDALGGGS